MAAAREVMATPVTGRSSKRNHHVAASGTTLAPARRHGCCRHTQRTRNAYQRRRSEDTALYELERDNIETLYGAIDEGALDERAACWLD